MTNELKCLMHIAGCASRGTPVDQREITDINWDRMVQLAKEQAVPFLLTYVLRRRKDLGCPEELRREWSAQMFGTLLETEDKRERTLALLQEMEAAGFQTVLLKGYVAADCYAVPECRISSDVDILVSEKQEAQVCSFLQKKGFEVTPRWTDGHHSICTHPDYGYFEIHASLFDRLVADVWFRDLDTAVFDIRNCVRIETNGGAYRTLVYTDNLLFMTLHMVKHFINGGICLRMMLDIALFMTKFSSLIDFSLYWRVLKTLCYDELVSSVLWSVVRYCGFDAADFPGIPEENEENVETLLSDLERGGWLGKNTPDEGRESHMVYSAYMQRKGVKNYQWVMLKQRMSNAFRRVFPARVVLMKYCPLVANDFRLLPYAWLLHVKHGVGVLFRTDSKHSGHGKQRNAEREILHDRASILKKMEMM